jgi:hypothetical protein
MLPTHFPRAVLSFHWGKKTNSTAAVPRWYFLVAEIPILSPIPAFAAPPSAKVR